MVVLFGLEIQHLIIVQVNSLDKCLKEKKRKKRDSRCSNITFITLLSFHMERSDRGKLIDDGNLNAIAAARFISISHISSYAVKTLRYVILEKPSLCFKITV